MLKGRSAIWLTLLLLLTLHGRGQQPDNEAGKGGTEGAGDSAILLVGFDTALWVGRPVFRIDSGRGFQPDNGATGVGRASRSDRTPALGEPFDAAWARVLQLLNTDPRIYTFRIRAPLENRTAHPLDISLYAGTISYTDAWLLSSGRASVHIIGGTLRAPVPGTTLLQQQYHILPLYLPPHWSGELLVSLRQPIKDFNFGALQLFSYPALAAAYATEYESDHGDLIFQWLFHGFLLFQLLYVLFQWIIIRRREYGYYFCYIAVVTLYFLLKFESRLGLSLLFTHLAVLKVYLGRTLLIFPYFLYFRFVRSFLEIPVRYPALNKWIVPLEYFLLAYMVFDAVFIFISFDQQRQYTFFTFVLLAIFLLSTSFIVYLFRYRQTLIYFVLTGSLLVAVGNIAGLLLSYLQNIRNMDLGVSNILIFSQVGVILEMVCFTAGLGYKRHVAEKEKLRSQERLIEQLQANEQLQARMQHIRNKIAQDLHDDIGSTLSSISILSDLALRGDQQGVARETIGEIKDSSLLLMERMDDIVWSINPRNDSLENLLMRVRHFATTLFEARGIEYQITIQKDLDKVRLPMDYRQHIYLILKEAINNLVKYAQAGHAGIRVEYSEGVLELEVRDDGRGWDIGVGGRTGNGLPGMQRRADLMGAVLEIRSVPGEGTAIVLRAEVG